MLWRNITKWKIHNEKKNISVASKKIIFTLLTIQNNLFGIDILCTNPLNYKTAKS